MLGFVSANIGRRTEWLVEPDLRGANLLNAERTMRDALTHRFWIDQRRGWRYTNPNLEQLGLIEATYLSLDELAGHDEEFEDTPILGSASPDERASALRALLDVMRKGLAVDCDALDRLKIESLAGRMRSVIKAPWLLEDEGSLAATVFMPRPPARREMPQKDEELIIRGTPTSTIGRQLRTMTFAGRRPTSRQMTEIVEGLLKAAARYGLATSVASPVGRRGLASRAVWDHVWLGARQYRAGAGQPIFPGPLSEALALSLSRAGRRCLVLKGGSIRHRSKVISGSCGSHGSVSVRMIRRR